MPTFSRHLAICSLSLSVSLFFLIGAAPSQAEADFQVCQACHGAKAEGNAALGAPALAGQLHDYLLRAMEEFAQGQRQNPQMAAVVASLQDSQRRARLANYLSTLPSPNSELKASGREPGYRAYQAKCAGCHGVGGEGNAALQSPKLVGLDKTYTAIQLQLFKSRERGSHSRYGKQMQLMANTIKDQAELALISTFISEM